MNKNIYLVLLYFFILPFFPSISLNCANNTEFSPEDEQQLREEYKKMFGEDIKEDELAEFKKIVSTVATELEKQEQPTSQPIETPSPINQQPYIQPAYTPPTEPEETIKTPSSIEKPLPSKPKDKRTNFLEPWEPQPPKQTSEWSKENKKEKEKFPKEKLEAFEFYTNKFQSLLNKTKIQISSMQTQKREKFKLYEKDLNEISSTITTIQSKKTYRISFFNEKFNSLRSKILEFINELELIIQDLEIQQTTDRSEQTKKSKSESSLEEISIKKDAPISAPLKIINPKEIKPAYESKVPVKELKKEEHISPIPEKTIIIEPNLTWYEKIWSKMKNGTLESFDFIKKIILKIFNKSEVKKSNQDKIEPTKSDLEKKVKVENNNTENPNIKLVVNDTPPLKRTDESPYKNLMMTPKVKPEPIIKPITTAPISIQMPTTRKSSTQDIKLPVTTPKPTQTGTDNITKMALKRLQKVLSNYLKSLNSELKEVVKTSKTRIEEKQKEQTEKTKKADALKKQRDSLGRSSHYPTSAGTGSHSGGSSSYYQPYYDPYMGGGGFGGGSYGGGGSSSYYSPYSSSDFKPYDSKSSDLPSPSSSGKGDGRSSESVPSKDTTEKEKDDKNKIYTSSSNKNIGDLINKEKELKKKIIDEVAELITIRQDSTKDASLSFAKIDKIKRLQEKLDDVSSDITPESRKDSKDQDPLDQNYKLAKKSFEDILNSLGIDSPSKSTKKSSKPSINYLKEAIDLRKDFVTGANIAMSLVEACTTQLAIPNPIIQSMDKGLRNSISDLTKKQIKISDLDPNIDPNNNHPEFIKINPEYQQQLKELNNRINILNKEIQDQAITRGPGGPPSTQQPFNTIP